LLRWLQGKKFLLLPVGDEFDRLQSPGPVALPGEIYSVIGHEVCCLFAAAINEGCSFSHVKH
jgi:hypothetical protein